MHPAHLNPFPNPTPYMQGRSQNIVKIRCLDPLPLAAARPMALREIAVSDQIKGDWPFDKSSRPDEGLLGLIRQQFVQIHEDHALYLLPDGCDPSASGSF